AQPMTMLAAPAIIPADARHLDNMMVVMNAAFDPGYGEAWSARQLASSLADPHCFARLAVADAGPQGFSLCRSAGPEVELLLIAVMPGRQGLGLGRQLLARVAQDGQVRGASELFLEVRENNFAARKLYSRCGFSEVGRRPDYYTGVTGERFAAISMQFNLGQLAL
ncbi:MAG: GNAT family N-acetyltransferase, partial [Sphingomonadales bacterium]